MDRLGLWGHDAFPSFADFLEVIGSRGVGALEMVAMDMKARGMYVCRTLSFAGTASCLLQDHSSIDPPTYNSLEPTRQARNWVCLQFPCKQALKDSAVLLTEQPKSGKAPSSYQTCLSTRPAFDELAVVCQSPGSYLLSLPHNSTAISGAEFEVVESELEEPLKSQYCAAARMWSQIRREFLYAIEQASVSKEEEGPKRGNMLWRFFWAAQQRFFRHLCMAAKVRTLSQPIMWYQH